MDRDRLTGIQSLRGIAALSVVVAHLPHEFKTKFAMPAALPNMDIGSIGVDIFFVLSGFIIVYSSRGLFGKPGAQQYFLSRRLIRIVPMYWLATTIICVWVLLVYGGFEGAKWSGWLVAASYVFIPYTLENGSFAPVLGVGWTLYYELFFYVAFAVSLCGTSSTTVLRTAFLILVIVGLGVIVDLPQMLAYWTNPVILEFVAGMLLARLYERQIRLRRCAAVSLFIAGFAAATFSWLVFDDFLAVRYFALGVPATMIVASVALSEPKGRIPAVLSALGAASYSIYLFHPFTNTLPRLVFGMSPGGHPYLYACMMVIVAVVVGGLVYLFIEAPLTRYLRRAVDRRRSRLVHLPAE